MKKISINNGLTFVSPAEALEGVKLEDLAIFMEEEARELAHGQCDGTDLDFLNIYLENAENDLIFG